MINTREKRDFGFDLAYLYTTRGARKGLWIAKRTGGEREKWLTKLFTHIVKLEAKNGLEITLRSHLFLSPADYHDYEHSDFPSSDFFSFEPGFFENFYFILFIYLFYLFIFFFFGCLFFGGVLLFWFFCLIHFHIFSRCRDFISRYLNEFWDSLYFKRSPSDKKITNLKNE